MATPAICPYCGGRRAAALLSRLAWQAATTQLTWNAVMPKTMRHEKCSKLPQHQPPWPRQGMMMVPRSRAPSGHGKHDGPQNKQPPLRHCHSGFSHYPYIWTSAVTAMPHLICLWEKQLTNSRSSRARKTPLSFQSCGAAAVILIYRETIPSTTIQLPPLGLF